MPLSRRQWYTVEILMKDMEGEKLDVMDIRPEGQATPERLVIRVIK